MTEHRFILEWIISEERLRALKNSTSDDECLESDKFIAVHASDVQYCLRIYPNGFHDGNRKQTWIALYLSLGKEKHIEAEFTFSVKTARSNHRMKYVFDSTTAYGMAFCTADKFFDLNNMFIVDGKFAVKIKGILNIAKAKSKWETRKNFGDLWNFGYEDFTIVAADKKEVKVHKCVLAAHSPVFHAMFQSSLKETVENKVDISDFSFDIVEKAVHKCVLAAHSPVFHAMFQSSLKETVENKVEISDFSFDIVEKAVKLCYGQKLAALISKDECILLLKFADKYDIGIIQDKLEDYLSDRIDVSNVCEVVDCAIAGNAVNIQNRCLDFITNSVLKQELIPNMELLDRSFLKKVFIGSSCRKSETL
uniref:BTB domain-containing protein n=1 Tax=Panagrolaimus sp. ES5 TaxID=591445 RepID=A0AC34G0Y7_9BILA